MAIWEFGKRTRVLHMLSQLQVLQQHSWEGVTQGWSLMNPTMCCLYWNGDGCDGDE